MVPFTTWLEYRQRGQGFYRSLVLGKLGLDRERGMDVPLESLERDLTIRSLESLGEYDDLPDSVKGRISSRIESGAGTVGDIVRIMSGSGS